MKSFFNKFFRNILDSFRGYNILWHILAIALTYIIVVTDFDWKYFTFFQHTSIYSFFFVGSATMGFIFPIFVPIGLLVTGTIQKNKSQVNTAWALAQAAIIGLSITSFYKVFTGRPSPLHPILATTTDISKIFHFGILQGGAFYGWPSSHTACAFAMATTLIIIHPKNKKTVTLATVYALFIGFGASISYHWFSDFVAGAIIGTVIGIVIGKSFKLVVN